MVKEPAHYDACACRDLKELKNEIYIRKSCLWLKMINKLLEEQVPVSTSG